MSGIKVVILEQVDLGEPGWGAAFGKTLALGATIIIFDVMSDKIVGAECSMENWLDCDDSAWKCG